jgi:hypothetical protein
MVLVDPPLPAGEDVVVRGDRADEHNLPRGRRLQQVDRADEVAPQVGLEIDRVPQRPPVHAVVDHAVGSLQELRPRRGIRLIAYHEPFHVRLDVVTPAGGPHEAGNRMSGLVQMPGDCRTDKPRYTG